MVLQPGVGTERDIVLAEAGGWRYVLPNNSLIRFVLQKHPLERAIRVISADFWRKPLSQTFHGRDIMPSVVGYLLGGTSITELGHDSVDLKPSDWPEVSHSDG